MIYYSGRCQQIEFLSLFYQVNAGADAVCGGGPGLAQRLPLPPPRPPPPPLLSGPTTARVATPDRNNYFKYSVSCENLKATVLNYL